MYFGNKYIVILSFDDFGLSLDGITINITGKVKVKFCNKIYKNFSRKQILSLKSSVYADMLPHIINNITNFEKIKLELNNFKYKPKNYVNLPKYNIIYSKIDDVFNIQKRKRKLKLEKINKFSK